MKELIELLRYTEVNGDRDPQNYVTNLCGSCYLCEQAADALERLEKQVPKWIPVTERLPEKEGTYLTYTEKESIHLDCFCIYPNHGTQFWVRGNGKVTHWMPLPPAPEDLK